LPGPQNGFVAYHDTREVAMLDTMVMPEGETRHDNDEAVIATMVVNNRRLAVQ
jgi:hypothetical protein